jgi:hypothetical protein
LPQPDGPSNEKKSPAAHLQRDIVDRVTSRRTC